MAWQKLFSLSPWKNLPSKTTPLGESRLNPQRNAIDGIDDRVIYLYETKLDIEVANTMVKRIDYNETNGVFTVTYLNGTTFEIDTKLEKLAINFRFDEAKQQLIIVLDDGTEQIVDLSALITQYEFVDSETIVITVYSDGKVTASVKEGSIGEKHLNPNYLGDIRVEAAKAEAAAKAAADSEENAAKSEKNAKDSGTAAAASAAAAAASEVAAKQSEINAKTSETNAKASEIAAATSEANAKASETTAAISEANAKQSEDNAKQSEINAAASAAAAAASEVAAKQSEINAAASAAAAKQSEINAKASELAAKTSEIAAAGSANTASNKAAAAISSAAAAAASATQAALSEQTANIKAVEASTSAVTATNEAKKASDSADLSKSYAVGTGNIVRPNDITDNAKSYAEQAAKSAALAETTAKINLPQFWIDFTTGELMATFEKPFNFYIDSNGDLICEVYEMEAA